MNAIVPMILDRIALKLQTVMVDNLAVDDETRCNEVKVGRYQQSPNQAMYRIAVMPGDLEDPNYLDGIAPRITRTHPLAFEIEAREIGGTQFWYRRGTVRVELFFIGKNYTEDKAREVAYAILSRAEANIENVYVADLVDDFGEKASHILHTGVAMFQSGGPPNSWIFHGKLMWDCLTTRGD